MTWLRWRSSLLTRITLISVVFILLGGSVRYILLPIYLERGLSANVAHQQEALAHYIAANLEQALRGRLVQLEHLAEALPPELLRTPVALGTWLRARAPLLPELSGGLRVYSPTGTLLTAQPPESTEERLHRALGAMQTPDRPRPIGRPYRTATTDRLSLPLSVPITSPQGQLLGYLEGISALEKPGFLDPLMRERIGKTGGFLLVSPQDRLFVASSTPAMVLRPTPAEGVNPLHDRAMQGFRGTGITRNAQGIEEISAIASVPSAGWFVVTRLPTAEAYAFIDEVQQSTIRVTLFTAVAVVALLAVIIRHVLTPLRTAADCAEKMSRDELPLTRLPVACPHDEVGHMTQAFNRLLEKLEHSQAELRRQAHSDPLTGLANRVTLSARLQAALAHAERDGQRIAVLFLDLDGFKTINDSLGHEAGDAALVEAAERLAGLVRDTDTLARVGGDEFVIVLGGLDAQPERAAGAAQALARQCLAAMEPPFLQPAHSPPLSLSIGIALSAPHSDADGLIGAADRAMYKAKLSGKGRYAMASEAPDASC
ncbi:MAG: GGDEF domain-containing protein [Burkholderiaceae bacterium]|nr:GGDEF domain-containing protein [Burkholderiaceae bacterium]